MSGNKLQVTVRRVTPFANVIDINGEITTFSEKELSEAFSQVVKDPIRTVILNFTDLLYMNSFGIGMLMTFLIRAQREEKKIIGYGLNAHFSNIFKITHLDQVIPIYSSEEIALAYAEPMDLHEREN